MRRGPRRPAAHLRLYTWDRLGAKTLAHTLNKRGHRTTAGGCRSAYQALRVLSNRVYLGELTFRGITATGCHPRSSKMPPLPRRSELAARGDDHAKRAANGSHYLLTGLMRCSSCGKAMTGTKAHGRSRVYRYYTCLTRLRYDTARCKCQPPRRRRRRTGRLPVPDSPYPQPCPGTATGPARDTPSAAPATAGAAAPVSA